MNSQSGLSWSQFRTLIESNADGMLVVGRSCGRVWFANPAALQLLNRQPEQVLDRPLGLPVPLGSATEIDIVRSDGVVRVAELRAVEIGWEGEPAYLATLRDTTDRREWEQALSRERDFVNAVLDTLGALVLVLDRDGRIIRENRAAQELFGYSRADLLSLAFCDLFPTTGDHRIVQERIERLAAEDGPQVCMSQVRTSSGRTRTVAWRVTGLRRAGRVEHVVSTGIDVTDLERARAAIEAQNEELERRNELLSKARLVAESASQAKSRFLATMSHEIRTPLNGILGTLNLLQGTPLAPDQQEYAELMHLSAEALLRVVNSILDFSRIESDHLDLAAEPFPLEPRLQDLIRVFRPEADGKGLQLGLRLDAEACREIVGDWPRLRQILVNLLGNALKFTESGSVHLDVSHLWSGPGQACLEFAVADTGMGIPADKLEGIFEPFTQVEDSHTRRFQGTGLGLAIASRLVERMGGRLQVRSVPGAGARFHFTLTFACPGADPEGPKADGPETAGAADLRILLVEDNPVNRRVTCRLLERQGWTVEAVANGARALDLLAREKFDVVLLDVEMPEMSGFDVVAALRERESGSPARTRVIAVTAHCLGSYRDRCLAAGMDEFLGKPFQAAELIAAIQRVVEPPEPG